MVTSEWSWLESAYKRSSDHHGVWKLRMKWDPVWLSSWMHWVRGLIRRPLGQKSMSMENRFQEVIRCWRSAAISTKNGKAADDCIFRQHGSGPPSGMKLFFRRKFLLLWRHGMYKCFKKCPMMPGVFGMLMWEGSPVDGERWYFYPADYDITEKDILIDRAGRTIYNNFYCWQILHWYLK